MPIAISRSIYLWFCRYFVRIVQLQTANVADIDVDT